MNLKMAIPFHEEQHQKTIEGTVILIPKVRSPMCTFKSTLKGRDLSFQDGFFFNPDDFQREFGTFILIHKFPDKALDCFRFTL